MSPIRTYPTKWNIRASDNKEQIEPYRCYYFICEGKNTETWYFTSFINKRKELEIKPTIHLHFLEKTGCDENLSSPKKLLELIEKVKNEEVVDFDINHDKFVVVFDADIFESQQNGYDEIIAEGIKNGYKLGVTNPSFELFLLLHYDNSYKTYIVTKRDDIINNKKVGKKRYITKLFSEVSGMNPKTNAKIGELVDKIKIAIEQEKQINNDITDCRGKITSSIGCILEEIINNDDEK